MVYFIGLRLLVPLRQMKSGIISWNSEQPYSPRTASVTEKLCVHACVCVFVCPHVMFFRLVSLGTSRTTRESAVTCSITSRLVF